MKTKKLIDLLIKNEFLELHQKIIVFFVLALDVLDEVCH